MKHLDSKGLPRYRGPHFDPSMSERQKEVLTRLQAYQVDFHVFAGVMFEKWIATAHEDNCSRCGGKEFSGTERFFVIARHAGSELPSIKAMNIKLVKLDAECVQCKQDQSDLFDIVPFPAEAIAHARELIGVAA